MPVTYGQWAHSQFLLIAPDISTAQMVTDSMTTSPPLHVRLGAHTLQRDSPTSTNTQVKIIIDIHLPGDILLRLMLKIRVGSTIGSGQSQKKGQV